MNTQSTVPLNSDVACEAADSYILRIRELATVIADNASDHAAIHPTSGFGSQNIKQDAKELHRLAVQLCKEVE